MLFTDAISEIDNSIRIITAANGVEALEKLKAGISPPPDYIFIDLNMPLMNGVQCLQEIKKLPEVSAIPVIIYSTSINPVDQKKCMQSGAYSCIAKPNSVEEIALIGETLLAFCKPEIVGVAK